MAAPVNAAVQLQQQQQQLLNQAALQQVQPGLQATTLQQQQLSQQQDFDPVHRFKMLIPQLKESLQVKLKQRRGVFTTGPYISYDY